MPNARALIESMVIPLESRRLAIRNDEAKRSIMNLVEMPDRMTENLVLSIRLNEGKLGRKRREGEFQKLTDDEVVSIEATVREAFKDFERSSILVTSKVAR